jgi:RNA polymerase sigma-70 factor, ECF subfamily
VNQAFVEAVPLAGAAPTEGFAELYERTFPRVYAYVASLLRDRSAAEDVTAQAFERAYHKRRSYRPARGSMDAWLFGIARNAALDELRRRRRVATLPVEPSDDSATALAPDAVEGALQRSVLRAAISSLAPRDRELVALKFFAGLSNAEIASVLEVSPSNAGTMLHRAVQKLRKACDATP